MTFLNFFKKKKQILNQEKSQVSTNRLKELKQLKQLANTYLQFYIERQKHSKKGWENDLSKRNIYLLKKSISKINKLQHNSKIKDYLNAINFIPQVSPNASKEEKETEFKKFTKNFATAFSQGTNFFLLLEINKCSPHISYFNDLTWFRHGTTGEHFEYGIGKVDETVFEKYLPYQIDLISKTKHTFFSNEIFKEDYILLDSTLNLIKDSKFIPANILIITLIEGLVRKFATLVYKKQNPSLSNSEVDDFAYIRNSSFECLIQSPEWKKDIPVTFSNLLTEYSHTDNKTITEFEDKFYKHVEANHRIESLFLKFESILKQHLENPTLSDEEFRLIGLKHVEELNKESSFLLSEEEKIVMIGLDVYLDFLVKKFKDDRNIIIHGKYHFFKEKWKTLFYLSALQALIDKILWYENNILSKK